MDIVFIFFHFRVLYSNLRYVKNTYQHWLFDPFGWVGGFQHVDLWAPQVGNGNPITPSTSSGLYIYKYIYMRIMLFIHIMFVLIVFNTCIYIKIYRKYILKIISIQKGLTDLPLIHIAKRPTQKLQVSWGCICCFLFRSEAQRSKGMGTWPDIQQSQVQVHCFAELWEVVICCG